MFSKSSFVSGAGDRVVYSKYYMLSYQIYSTLGGVQIPDCQPLFSLYLGL